MKFKKLKQQGWVSLWVTLVVLLSASGVVLYTSKVEVMEQKINANEYRSKLAFEAAEAGSQYAKSYLRENNNTIVVDSNFDGVMDAYSNNAITSVAMPNGSKYSITYSNPIPNELEVIKVTSVGVSPDATTARTISRALRITYSLTTAPNFPIIAKGAVDFNGNTIVINTETDLNIWSGGAAGI